MSNKFIVTISRQFGSGGREIGKKIADSLGIEFYDKELISLASKESGFCENVFEKADEAPSNSFLYSLVMGSNPMSSLFFRNDDLLTNDKLFSIQSKVIKNIANEKSCVIVGRCSDYILREEKNLTRVYFHADMDFRVKRTMELYKQSEKDANASILKADKKRNNYYNYYTGNEWTDLNNYDIIINTSKIGVENSVKAVINYVNMVREINNVSSTEK